MNAHEAAALEAAIEKEFDYRVNHTYGMMRWGLSAFKKGWEAGKTEEACPYPRVRYGVSVKQAIWQRGKNAHAAYVQQGRAK